MCEDEEELMSWISEEQVPSVRPFSEQLVFLEIPTPDSLIRVVAKSKFLIQHKTKLNTTFSLLVRV